MYPLRLFLEVFGAFFGFDVLDARCILLKEEPVDAFDLLHSHLVSDFAAEALPILQLSRETRIRGHIVTDLCQEVTELAPRHPTEILVGFDFKDLLFEQAVPVRSQLD